VARSDPELLLLTCGSKLAGLLVGLLVTFSDLLLEIAERRPGRQARIMLLLGRLFRHLVALLALFEKPSHRGNARAQHSAVELLPQSIGPNRAAQEVTGSDGGLTASAQAGATRSSIPATAHRAEQQRGWLSLA
jgi:hypothetical protein